MSIRLGDNPEGAEGVNKFLAGNEGFRGRILALHQTAKKAIVLALTTSLDQTTVVRGRLYEVTETHPDQYPVVTALVTAVPNRKQWKSVSGGDR